MRPGVLAASALLAVMGGAAWAHVRLQNPSNGNQLFWNVPASVSIVINSTGSDDIADGSHFTAARNAIAAWNADTGTTARLIEDTNPAQQARTDWQDTSIHLVLFDENDSSGYFPPASGTVAITPIWFLSTGRITDADVLFNGSGFQFTTSAAPGAFDVQAIAAHELGHLLGLDHSGWASATMYPYVDSANVLQRSLSRDELRGLRDAYPASAFASISGTIRRSSDSSLVAGAHVVARDAAGRTTAGALADGSGAFTLEGLEAGSYTLFASPLDFPVSAANLVGGQTVHTDFESTMLGTFVVAAGQALATGPLDVETDVLVSMGRNSDQYPLRCVAGTTQGHRVRGWGLDPGSTLAASDPALTITPTAWAITYVDFDVTVPAGAAIGHVDLTATTAGGERSILPAALEITPANPGVVGASPSSGTVNGGTALTIDGAGFNPGARVVIGGAIYADGQPGGCTVVDPATITLVTAATAAGTYDVVVIDPSGVEGRAVAGYQFGLVPVIDTVFPAAGSAAGGTDVVIRGTGFVAGSVVRIDGIPQTVVSVDSATRISVTTNAYAPGGPYLLEVEAPGGGIATAAYSYSLDPDPVLAAVDPATGPAGGGPTITLDGANLQPTSDVWFGVDPDTGLGGTLASDFDWVDASTVRVTLPAHAAGVVSVMLLDNLTGQASVLSGGFTYASSGGGGGGGCHAAPFDAPRGRWDPLAGAGWMLALLALAAWRARRLSPARAAHAPR